MTPTFRSGSGANTGSGGTAITVAKPTGTVTGDLLVALQTQDADSGNTTSLTNPSGAFTTFGSGNGSASRAPYSKLWYKIATASEPTYTFNNSSSSNHAVIILCFVGGTFDPNNPIGTAPSWQTATKTGSHVAPSVTGIAGGLLVCGFCADTGGTAGAYTPPSGMTELQETDAGYCGVEASSLALASSAVTGTKTATNTRGTNSGYNDCSFVISPPPSANQFMPFFGL